MKRLLLIIATFVAINGHAQSRPATSSTTSPKKKVAVYITGDLETSHKEIIASRLTTLLTQSEQYVAMERTYDFINEINKEQDFQYGGIHVGDEQIAKIGQRLMVDYVAIIKISRVFNELYLTARILNVLTKEILVAAETTIDAIRNMDSLLKTAKEISVFLLFDFNDVKISQAINEGQTLYNTKTPEGYHIATHDELSFLLKVYQARGKRTYLPAILDPKLEKYRKSHSILGSNPPVTCFYSLIRGTFKQISKEKPQGEIIEFWSQEMEHSCSTCLRVNMTKPTSQPFTPSYLYFVKN